MSLLEELAQQGVTAEELNKAASAKLFAAEAQAEGIDLSKEASDRVEALYGKWVEEKNKEIAAKVASAQGTPAAPAATDDQAKLAAAARSEAAAKIAEAEYIGRYMGRCFLDEVQKEAGEATNTATGAAKRLWESAKGVGGAVGKELKSTKSTYGGSVRASEAQSAAGHPAAKGFFGKHMKALSTTARKHKGVAGAAAGTAAAGGAGIAVPVALHKKDKEASVDLHKVAGYLKTGSADGGGEIANDAFEQLVAQKATEILAANGYDLSAFVEEEEPEVKQAAAEDPDAVVDQAAYESAVASLKNVGYSFQE